MGSCHLTPQELSALVARGTARALMRKLHEAVEDFTKAIDIEPRCATTALGVVDTLIDLSSLSAGVVHHADSTS